MALLQFIGMKKYNLSCMKYYSYGVWGMVCIPSFLW